MIESQTPGDGGRSSNADSINGESLDSSDPEQQLCFQDVDSTCSTPYVSAPSSPGGGGPFFYSGPTSPMHSAISKTPIQNPSMEMFEFDFCARFGSNGSMSSADELFLNGKIRPMKLSNPLFPLEVEDEEMVRGRVLRWRTRSMSPLRNSIEIVEKVEETAEVSSPTISGSSSVGRRWVFLKDFLHRSKSEGSSFWSKKSAKKDREKVGNGVGRRRVPPMAMAMALASPHELHYTAKRAEWEEKKKKTYLPHRQGLLGCLGFSSKGYGFAKAAFNSVSST